MNLRRTATALLGLFLSIAAHADYYAYIGEGNGNFERLDISTGQSTFIGSNGLSYSGLAFGADGSLYGTTFSLSSLSTLLKIDPATGANTIVGSTGFAITAIAGLADGSLFAVDYADRLLSVNAATGAATVLGATGLPDISTLNNFANSLASDGHTLYYTLAADDADGFLYTLNLQTGLATLVGNTGVADIAGSVYASTTPTDGTLFGFGASGAVYTINTATGATAVFATTAISDIFGGVGITYQTAAIPEPGSTSLALCGLAALLAWSRRRGGLR